MGKKILIAIGIFAMVSILSIVVGQLQLPTEYNLPPQIVDIQTNPSADKQDMETVIGQWGESGSDVQDKGRWTEPDLKQLEQRIQQLELELDIAEGIPVKTRDDLERRIHDLEIEMGVPPGRPSRDISELERRVTWLEREAYWDAQAEKARLERLEWRIVDLERELEMPSNPLLNTKDDLERRITDMEGLLRDDPLYDSPFNTIRDLERRVTDLQHELEEW
jgi:chromosome segregation ATPase